MAGYVSKLNPNEPLLDDNFDWHDSQTVDGETKGRGLKPRNYELIKYGSMPFATAFPSELLIDESEWDDRIQEMEKNKTRLSDKLDQAGVTVLDQRQTSFCWIFAPTHAVEVLRVVNGQPFVRLSPASAGCKIKNFRNEGGWGTEGLKYIIEHGLVPDSLWPMAAISRQYDTPAADAERSKYRVHEWWELKPRNLAEHMSCLLMNLPVAVGLNYWGHEVLDIDPVAFGNGKYGARFNNSWGLGFGDRGRAVRTGSKLFADDAVTPRVPTPS